MLAASSAALRRELPASRHIPYAAHVAPNLIRTFAGDYVQSFRVSGASFESADDDVLNNWHERLNVTWRNIASPQVALWMHVIRHRERVPVTVAVPADVQFADGLEARYQRKLSGETLMVNELFLSLVYRPVAGVATGLLAKTLSRRNGQRADLADALESCGKLAETVAAALARYEPKLLGVYSARGRWHSELLEFLGLLVNGESQPFPLPRAPINEVLATTRPVFGTETLEYRLPTTTRVASVLGIKEYPTPSLVGMFNALLSAPFSFVLTQSFGFLSKATAQGLLQRQYHQMSNAGDFAISQAEELKDALDAVTANEFVMGDHHLTLQVVTEIDRGRDEVGVRLRELNDSTALARTVLAETGMTVAREDLALEAAFWAQLPGNFALRTRKSPITSRNFAAMAPLHNFPVGRATDNHWGDALAVFMSSARSPYYFSLHASDPKDPDGGSRKDTGHTFICGPTGSGKTVFVGFLVALLARREVTQVVFDKDRGLEILLRALGGIYLPLKSGVSTGCNPLQLPVTPSTLEFLKFWVRTLVRSSSVLSAREEADLDNALRGTMALPREARRLSRLIEYLDATRAEGVYARLARWCESTGGDYAWVFDNREDSLAERLSGASVIGFDVTEFLDHEAIRTPLTLYLFHVVRQLLDGRRFVCWADEFSRLLSDAAFEQFAKDGLKVWRKLNGVFCAATQSPSDALGSAIARTIIEQTPTKIFFPNPDALESEYTQGFGLTDREFRLLKDQIEPGSRRFLVKQGHASVVCELDLKGFDEELAVISGRASSIVRMNQAIAEAGSDPADWLPRFWGRPVPV
jgi:type IV secretion system protein VirB4